MSDAAADFEPRELHLHTLDSLICDLVSGRAVLLSTNQEYLLPDEHTQSALNWYQELGQKKWSANVSASDGEAFVDAVLQPPADLPILPARSKAGNTRRLTLKKLEAHRFAGLHKFGSPAAAPLNYEHNFSSPITLFEGRNGSGKTSLANAIIWTLTGEILRPQRHPEKTEEDFLCWVDPVDDGIPSEHRMTPVTPMPDTAEFRPTEKWVPADTWVELTFEDENGNVLPPIRRTHTRTSRGKPIEEANLDVLGVDPVATRIGTLMPGLLGLIKVGSESELGRAVSTLTGLSALVDLADHARRLKQKVEKDFTKTKTRERELADEAYLEAKSDLEKEYEAQASIKPLFDIPPPSHDKAIEKVLADLKGHFDRLKSEAYSSAREILGSEFDPEDGSSKTNLERNIGPALNELSQLHRLSSLSRLHGLKSLADEQIAEAEHRITEIIDEAAVLTSLAADPSAAGRARLYARIASWITDHPGAYDDPDVCVVCKNSLIDVKDPVTGKAVKQHIEEAKSDAELLSQTIKQWAQAVINKLSADLPEPLQREIRSELPAHPCDLLREAVAEELFELPSFSDVLSPLKAETAAAFDIAVSDKTQLPDMIKIELPVECNDLALVLTRLDTALRFANWRKSNDMLAHKIFRDVIGKPPADDQPTERTTLTGKLLDLHSTVRAAKPLTDALGLCDRLVFQIGRRRTIENRLDDYAAAGAAAGNLLRLGELADIQVDELRKKLSGSAASWRNKIYLGAFPTIAHELVDASLGRAGELDLKMRAGGVCAPAQHITNSSALRASLVAFYLAFWEHVIVERGGLNLILFDDPQELLDDENRERLAGALCDLTSIGAQLVMTSYDPRFSGYVARKTGVGAVSNFEVLPATRLNPTIRTNPPRSEIVRRKEMYDQDRDAEGPARDYADACRIFVENKLGDIFEDPAFSSWTRENQHPAFASYVSRLRQEIKAAGPQSLFSAHVFKNFISHAALADNSPEIRLMNKSHHGQRSEIRAGDVEACAESLEEITAHVENMWSECSRWRRRDTPPVPSFSPPMELQALKFSERKITICPDLAAFTEYSTSGESQEQIELLDSSAFANKAVFYLRRGNFGFAAPEGSLAIVESDSSAVEDRRLAVARHADQIYARRVLRPQGSKFIGLTAETLDPRKNTPKTKFISEDELALHRVVGVIFDHSITCMPGPEEAVLIEASDVFQPVELAYRVIDDSAVPLALSKQIVLGGAPIELHEMEAYSDRHVALQLRDGSSLFKRVGAKLTGGLSHLRQFESIGGLGSSQVLSIGVEQSGVEQVVSARLILGVLYHG